MARAVLAILTIALVLSCAPRTPAEKLASLAEQTKVCVDNTTIHSMRVEVLDAYSGYEFGEVYVQPIRTACEWMRLPEGSLFDARIKSVSVRHDVIPPAWTDMMLGPGPMILVAGADGLTPFAHSHRRR